MNQSVSIIRGLQKMSYKLQNPIIPGYYPDPSIIRVGDDFYIAVSSFEMSPGIPIFHSKDLANWEQIANAIGPENGIHMSKNCGVGGIMAPTLRYHDGTYYIINANFTFFRYFSLSFRYILIFYLFQ